MILNYYLLQLKHCEHKEASALAMAHMFVHSFVNTIKCVILMGNRGTPEKYVYNCVQMYTLCVHKCCKNTNEQCILCPYVKQFIKPIPMPSTSQQHHLSALWSIYYENYFASHTLVNTIYIGGIMFHPGCNLFDELVSDEQTDIIDLSLIYLSVIVFGY